VSDDGLRALASFTALINLYLNGCEQVSDDGLHTLAGLAALIYLNLAGCDQVSDDGLIALQARGHPPQPHNAFVLKIKCLHCWPIEKFEIP
jgi:hypothetical protein